VARTCSAAAVERENLLTIIVVIKKPRPVYMFRAWTVKRYSHFIKQEPGIAFVVIALSIGFLRLPFILAIP
jgi:hypothetical protein